MEWLSEQKNGWHSAPIDCELLPSPFTIRENLLLSFRVCGYITHPDFVRSNVLLVDHFLASALQCVYSIAMGSQLSLECLMLLNLALQE